MSNRQIWSGYEIVEIKSYRSLSDAGSSSSSSSASELTLGAAMATRTKAMIRTTKEEARMFLSGCIALELCVCWLAGRRRWEGFFVNDGLWRTFPAFYSWERKTVLLLSLIKLKTDLLTISELHNPSIDGCQPYIEVKCVDLQWISRLWNGEKVRRVAQIHFHLFGVAFWETIYFWRKGQFCYFRCAELAVWLGKELDYPGNLTMRTTADVKMALPVLKGAFSPLLCSIFYPPFRWS